MSSPTAKGALPGVRAAGLHLIYAGLGPVLARANSAGWSFDGALLELVPEREAFPALCDLGLGSSRGLLLCLLPVGLLPSGGVKKSVGCVQKLGSKRLQIVRAHAEVCTL